jgi:Zn-dependent protease
VAAFVVKVRSVVGSLGGTADVVFMTLDYAIYINLILAFFNLIPIPPLDGSHVLAHALPPELAARYREMGRYGLLIVMAMLFLAPGFMDFLLTPVFALRGLADQFIRLWS